MNENTAIRKATDQPVSGTVLQRVKSALELLFLLLLGIYLFYQIESITMLYMVLPENLELILLRSMAVVALLHLPLVGLKRREVWVAVAFAAVCSVTYFLNNYFTMGFVGVAVLGLIGVDARRVYRVYLPVAACMLIVGVTAALTGGITSLAHYRNGIRSCWGFNYPTDLASLVLFVSMILWAAWERMPDWGMLILSALPLCVATRVTQSRNSMLCTVLFIAVILWHMLETRMSDREPGRMRKLVDGLLTVAFPLCAAIALGVFFLYCRQPERFERLDALLSSRLSFIYSFFKEHGISPFGKYIKMRGLGFTDIAPADNRTIDCAYLYILIRFGWVSLLALGAMWTWLTRRAIKAGQRRMALVMGVIAVHSMLEPHFAQLYYNLFLGMLLAELPVPVVKKHGRHRRRARNLASAVALGVLVLTVVLSGPLVFSRLRTVFTVLGWHGGEENALPVVGVVLACAAALLAVARAIYCAVYAAALHVKMRRQAVPLLLLAAAVAIGGIIWTEDVIDRGLEEYAETLDAEGEGIQTILDSATGAVYENGRPEVYLRRFGGFRRTMLSGNDLARLDDVTVLMGSTEHRVFFPRGFLFTALSDTHTVYTSDAAVIEALKDSGYEVTDYYSMVKKVSVSKMSRYNTSLTKDKNGLMLEGPKKSLVKGPRDDLYGGQYKVTYKLRLTKKSKKRIAKKGDDALVCTLRVTADSGKTLITEQPVTLDQFGEKLKLTVEVPFAIGDTNNVEFQAIAAKKTKVYITGVSYQKVGR